MQRPSDNSAPDDTLQAIAAAREDVAEYARLYKLTENERVKDVLRQMAYGAATAVEVLGGTDVQQSST